MRTKQLLIVMLLLATVFGAHAQKRGKRTTLSLTGRTYHIRNVANGRYLDIPGYGHDASTSNGANVQMWEMDKGMDRRWYLLLYSFPAC